MVKIYFRVVLFFCLLFGCSLGFAAGERYERIVSLAPSVTESLFSLEVEDRIMAVTSYCNYPPEAKLKPKIGTMTTPNIEKLFSLRPDLVLVSKGLTSKKIVDKIRSLGIKVVIVKPCQTFGDIAGNYTELARLIGVEKKAQEVLSRVESEVDNIRKTFVRDNKERVFWQVGAKPLVTVGKFSYVNDFIEICGGINVFKDLPALYPRVSREEVLTRNPDWVILITMGDVTEKEREYWAKFPNLGAVNKHQVCVIDADLVCTPTPLGFLTGLKEVARIFDVK